MLEDKLIWEEVKEEREGDMCLGELERSRSWEALLVPVGILSSILSMKGRH